MEYTVQKLANMAGISTRTLRYYDEIGILKPARINSSGYRIYGHKEVDLLQQILFYRELGVGLEGIKELVTDPHFDGTKALKDHREKLIEKRNQLNKLIENVDKTIFLKEGRIKMSDQERFEGFKKKMIEENERNYGEEIRKKYGEEAVQKSYDKVRGMSKEQHDQVKAFEGKLAETLERAFQTGDPSGELAQEAADLHKQWLTFYWQEYSKEAHANLAQMYVEDERFTAYYDKTQPGTAEFLKDAILIYTGKK